MADTLTLTLEPRTVLGKKVKSLRKAGIIPVHIYGQGIKSQALQCASKTLYRVLAQAGMNTPISLTIPGQKDQRLTFVREIQWDPLRGDMLHVDFLHVDVANEITASVPIVLTGDSPAVRVVAGASVVQLLRELEVRALPLDIPSEIAVSLELIEDVGDVIRVADTSIPDNVILTTDQDELIARLDIAREEEAPVSADELELGEGVEGGQESDSDSESA